MSHSRGLGRAEIGDHPVRGGARSTYPPLMKALARLAGTTPLLLALLTAREASADLLPPPPPSSEPAGPAPTAPPPPASPAPTATLPPPAPPPLPSPSPPAEPPPVQPVFTAPAPPPEPQPEPEPEMSEGRRIVSMYNSGFQWGLSPGIAFSGGKAGFLLGARVGYGFDTGKVILIPGVQLSGYFLDPTVLVGMPVFRVVVPIDRFAPFVEGGVGVGSVTSVKTGLALNVGGGFMIHFTRSFGLGAEVSYQTITGTTFKGIGIGPVIAFAF